MRLWSLHPRYLDPTGLVALWREGLLAQKVLLGQTRGYRAHPQLTRFAACVDPVHAIGGYLAEVVREATARGYSFDHTKLVRPDPAPQIPVTRGQLDYEWEHLMAKLALRAPALHEAHASVASPEPHPGLVVVDGPVEAWERRS